MASQSKKKLYDMHRKKICWASLRASLWWSLEYDGGEDLSEHHCDCHWNTLEVGISQGKILEMAEVGISRGITVVVNGIFQRWGSRW